MKKSKLGKIISGIEFFKEMFWNPMGFLMLFAMCGLFLVAYFYTTPKKYVGTIIYVSSWDGNAELKTKTEIGKDTILKVHARRNERFEKGQVITVWTGGDLIGDIATTQPQH